MFEILALCGTDTRSHRLVWTEIQHDFSHSPFYMKTCLKGSKLIDERRLMTEAKKETVTTETVKQILRVLEKNETLRKQFLRVIKPKKQARRDEIAELLDEIKQLRIEGNQRFEAMQRQIDEHLKESAKQFKAMQKQMDERFKASDERFKESAEQFKAMQKQMDERFKESDERFKAMQEQIDRRFEKVFERFDELSLALGHDFEEFNSYWLETFLVEQGYPEVKVKKVHFADTDYEVFPDSQDVEVDLFNENPFVIGEVTAIVRSIDKVTTFLRKIKFLEKQFGRKADYKLFITYMVSPEIRDEVKRLLQENGVTLITVGRHQRYN